MYLKADKNVLLVSDSNRAIMINTKLIPEKTTRTSVGVQLYTLKAKQKLASVYSELDEQFGSEESYKKIKIPAVGVALTHKDKKLLEK